jgi:hypothetical protein
MIPHQAISVCQPRESAPKRKAEMRAEWDIKAKGMTEAEGKKGWAKICRQYGWTARR